MDERPAALQCACDDIEFSGRQSGRYWQAAGRYAVEKSDQHKRLSAVSDSLATRATASLGL